LKSSLGFLIRTLFISLFYYYLGVGFREESLFPHL
ncbi:hypothetical protein LINPERPRIM_LOCUS21801, partial [Linum perenne]